MTTKDLLDAAIIDRIQILLHEVKKQMPKEKSDNILKTMDLALEIISTLPQEQQTVLNQMLNQTVDGNADIELALYKGGLSDGLHIMKYLHKL